MSSLFSKFTGSAIQLAKQGSAQLISSVNKAKSAIASTAVNLSAAATAPSPLHQEPEISKIEQLDILFKNVCEIIDQLAVSPDANTLEMDTRLNQTEIRIKLRRIVEILSQEAQLWLVNQRSIADSNCDNDAMHMSDTPCLDHFIQMNMISELCNRAMSDSPRGILRLSLTAISTILRQIPYPLLPHQSIYRPVAKIIFIASRYEAFIQQDSTPRKSSAEKEKYSAFIRRMDISLTSLLRTIWRKIVENPPCLDYFIVADRRTSSVDQYVESSRGLPKMQIDVLSSLLPLVHSPKVGHYAQESILIALNIRDTRVDFYLAYNTGFTFSLVRNVCDDFNAALHFLQKQLTANSNIIIPSHLIPFCAQSGFGAPFLSSHSAGTPLTNKSLNISQGNNTVKSLTPPSTRASITSSSISGGGILGFFPAETPKDMTSRLAQEQSQRQQKKMNEEETYNAVTQFLNSLTFLRAVFNSLRSRETKDDKNAQPSSGGVKHCLQRISDTFYAEFIQGCLHNAMDATNEVQNSAVYILVKLLLGHLAWGEESDSDSSEKILHTNRRKLYDNRFQSELSLLGETLNYLLYSVSIDKNQNLSSLSAETRSDYSVHETTFRPSAHYRSILDRSTSMSKSLSSSANMLLFLIVSTVPPLLGLKLLSFVPPSSQPPTTTGSKSSTSNLSYQLQLLPFDISPLTFDDALVRTCAVLELDLNKEKTQPAASLVLRIDHGHLPVHIEHATHNLFRKLFHRGDDILKQIGKIQSSESIVAPSNIGSAPDTMLFRALKRLHGFSSLRIDEQITLSGLVNEMSCLLCTSMLLSAEKEAKVYLQQFYTLWKKINSLRTELNVIVRQIPDVRKKILMMREHLQEEALLYVTIVQEKVDVSSNIQTPAGNKAEKPVVSNPSLSKPSSSSQSRRKLIESETMQNKQLLTSAIILQEMEHEVVSYMFAVKAVSRMVQDQHSFLLDQLSNAENLTESPSSADIFFGESLAETRQVDEEEYRADLEDTVEYKRLLATLSSNEPPTLLGMKGFSFLNLDKSEQDFLSEIEQLEKAIESEMLAVSMQ